MFQFTLNCLVIHSGKKSAERLFEAFMQRIAGVALRVSYGKSTSNL